MNWELALALSEVSFLDLLYNNKVGHLLSEFWCRICGLEFSDSLLINLLSKIRHRKLCVGIVVSNVDRIPVPTVDDQPL